MNDERSLETKIVKEISLDERPTKISGDTE